jgi:hypothetical protein
VLHCLECIRYSGLIELEGFPTLAIFGPDGKLVTEAGVRSVVSDPDGLRFPWAPPLVKDLNEDDVVGFLNSSVCVCVMAEGASAEFHEQIMAALTPMAAEAATADVDGFAPHRVYMICKQAGPVSDQINRNLHRSPIADSARDVADVVYLDLSNCRYAIQQAPASVTAAGITKFVAGVADGSIESIAVKADHGGG